MSKNSSLTPDQVKHLVKLAKLPLEEKLLPKMQKQLESTFNYINKIQSLNTKNIDETSQVTGQTNVFRQDKVERNRMLTQKQILSGAMSIHNGFFKVSAIFTSDE